MKKGRKRTVLREKQVNNKKNCFPNSCNTIYDALLGIAFKDILLFVVVYYIEDILPSLLRYSIAFRLPFLGKEIHKKSVEIRKLTT